MDRFEFELEQYVCTWSAPPAIATSGLHTECLLVVVMVDIVTFAHSLVIVRTETAIR